MNHFSKKIINALSRKGVSFVGTQAVPAFEGDQYFSGTAYKLSANGQMLVRTYQQVMSMACSSWTVDYDPTKD